jgi:uncharacterized protein
MDWTGWIEGFGEPAVLAVGGVLSGLLFGFFAQRSRFCLRAAVIEFWHGKFGEKLAVWLLAFSTAVVAVQRVCWTSAPRASSRPKAACRAR